MKLKSNDRGRRTTRDPRRLYGQRCGVARALDLVGERWTLLLIRDLMIGPRRFKDILESLPGIGTNLLTKRLRELEEANIVLRRVLPPPAGSTVYELTEVGAGLEPVVFALGKWGRQFMSQPIAGEVSKPGWFMVALRSIFCPKAALRLTARYELRIDGEMFVVEIEDRKIRVGQGAAINARLTLTTDLSTLIGLVSRDLTPAAALRNGKAIIDGDRQGLEQFVKLFDWNAGQDNDDPGHATARPTPRPKRA
jgi:DNA-binding HxlR family transcriptional regulator